MVTDALLSDLYDDDDDVVYSQDYAMTRGYYDRIFVHDGNWCEALSAFAETCDEPICLFLDDFFMNAPVEPLLIQRGLEQMEAMQAGCVRLFPCPGPDEDYGDPHFGIVGRGARYRISTQAALWNPEYLRKVVSCGKTPWELELDGSPYSDSLMEPVLSFKPQLRPYPVSYLGAIRHGRCGWGFELWHEESIIS